MKRHASQQTQTSRKGDSSKKVKSRYKGDVCLKRFKNKCNQISGKVVNEPQLPYVNIDLGVKQTLGLIDSGATRSIINKQLLILLEKHKLVKRTQPVNIKCVTATSREIPILCSATIKIKIEHYTWCIPLLVSEELALDIILGADFIRKSGIILHLYADEYYFKFNRDQRYKFVTAVNENRTPPTTISRVEQKEHPLGHLQETDKKCIMKIIQEFPTVLTSKLGLTHLIEYKITLNDPTIVRLHPYKLPPPKMEIMRQQINKLLEQKVIEPSTSPYSSPAFLIPKSTDKHRLVIDYRQLNKKIEFESVPLPDIHGAFHYFSEAKVFTVMDLNQAFHQIPLAEESKKLTAFAVPFNLYQFTRVPFGLSQGSSVCSRLLEKIFHDLKFKYVYHYLDDIVIYSKSMREHVNHLREVLSRLRQAGLTVNPEKVNFATSKFSFLGHIVSSDGNVSIDQERTRAIREFLPPCDAKGIARFLGMINYFHKYIPRLADVAAPLNALRKKGVKFRWTPEHQRAFEILKDCIIQPPVLQMANFSKEFVVQTDSSSVALGAVICQEVDGTRLPISYASRTLTEQERKYSAYELECLAVIFAVEKFRPFLEHKEFLLETDNQALSWMLNHPKQLGRIGRWVLRLNCYKFRVRHIRGTQNVIADSLSRMFQVPVQETHTETKLEQNGVNTIITDFPLAFTRISEYQRRDPKLRPIIEELESGKRSDKYILSKDVLCSRNKNNQKLRIMAPEEIKPMLLEYFHSSTLGAHMGVKKTIHRVKREYMWENMNRDIIKFVRNCELCALSKPAKDTLVGKLVSEPPAKPFEKVYVDFSGPYPRSKSGNTMLLICVDAFSKFVWMYPMRQALASTTVNILQNRMFKDFGTPVHLVSDNGPQFKSKQFRDMCFRNSINHITVTEYRPQGNLAERYLRNLKAALIAYHAKDQTTWDQNLSWIQFAFNTSYHEGHKFTPFGLLFTYSPNHPLSTKWNIQDLIPDQKENRDIKKVWNQARENLRNNVERAGKYYNQKRKESTYQEGDLVMYRTHPTSSAINKTTSKLSYKWTGPYQINKYLTPVTVTLHDPETKNFIRRSHVSQIKPRYNGNKP